MTSEPPTTNAPSPEDRPSFLLDIRAGDLDIDRKYQPRERYDERRAERMSNEWDWAQYQPLQVGIYNSEYWIIDGQHRWNAAVKAFGDDIKLPCYVVGQVTIEEAARIFANADKNRVRLGVNHKFAALLAARDSDAERMVAILASHGWQLVTDGSTTGSSVSCIATIERIYRDSKGGPERLSQTMRVIAQAWNYTPKSSSAIVIGGVGRFLKRYGGEPQFSEATLIKKLRDTNIGELVGPEAGAIAVELGMRVGSLNHLAVAYAIRDRYNHNLRPKSRRVGVTQEQ